VTATRASTSLSTVFYDSGFKGSPPANDSPRGIHYQHAEIELDHVLASAAMPTLFPARRVERPVEAKGWYTDGGTRLNAPIKPALALGARKVIIIAVHCPDLSKRAEGGARPDVLMGASELVQALLVDPLVNDVHTLVMINQLISASAGAGAVGPLQIPSPDVDREYFRTVPYILIAPENPYAIGRIAAKHYVKHYKGLKNIRRRHHSVAKLARLLDVDRKRDVVRGELLSYLFFDAEFADELMELGRQDARTWLSKTGTMNPWMTVHHPPVSDEAVHERDQAITAAELRSREPAPPSEVPAGDGQS
jgi:NTE family protein